MMSKQFSVRCARPAFAAGARRTSSISGFSLIEMTITMAILVIVGSVTFISLNPAVRNIRVNNAQQTVIGAVDLARSRATSMRRTYMVTFVVPNSLTVTDASAPAAPPVLNISLPSDISFDAEPGIPFTNAAAPDRLGNGLGDGPICFDIGVTVNCSNSVIFYPDGSARDAAGNVNNGVVYLARRGELFSSRAVTVFGLSGRVRGYRLYQGGGAGVTYWRQQ